MPLPKCLTPGCSNRAAWKGLCAVKCYRPAKKLVEEGKTTWEELIKMGLAATKCQEIDQSSPSPFLAEFEKRKNA